VTAGMGAGILLHHSIANAFAPNLIDAIYCTVLGLVVTSLALSATLGAMVLSFTLSLVDHFRLYMLVAGGSSVVGALLFLMLGRRRDSDASADADRQSPDLSVR